MIQLKEVQTELTELLATDQNKVTTAEYKRKGRRARLLTECKYYIETNPSEVFIKQILDAKKKELDMIETGFGTWQSHTDTKDLKNPRAAYDTEMGTKKVKFQIKVLKYLLG